MLNRLDVLSDFQRAVGLSCRNQGIKLNAGFSRLVEEFQANRTDEPRDFYDLVSRGIERRLNLLQFEDDAMIYLILQGANFILGDNKALLVNYAQLNRKGIEQRVEVAQCKLERARVYQANADFRMLFMASGILNDDESKREEAAECYYLASDLRKRREGTFSSYGMLLDKLALRFERYFGIMAEAFEHSSFKHAGEVPINLTRDERINALIAKLDCEKEDN